MTSLLTFFATNWQPIITVVGCLLFYLLGYLRGRRANALLTQRIKNEVATYKAKEKVEEDARKSWKDMDSRIVDERAAVEQRVRELQDGQICPSLKSMP